MSTTWLFSGLYQVNKELATLVDNMLTMLIICRNVTLLYQNTPIPYCLTDKAFIRSRQGQKSK